MGLFSYFFLSDSSLFSSVQFSCSVVSNSLWPHGLQHTRLPCPTPTPRAYTNSCLSSQWCHPTISYSVVPFSSCLQFFPGSGPFLRSQFFAWGGQRIGVSASASVFPMNIQDWFPLGLTGLYPCSPRNSEESPPIPQFKSINTLALSFLYSPTFTSDIKGPSSQSYGFSSGHVWMWELDYKESWAPKNWCFWTVVRRRPLRVFGM